MKYSFQLQVVLQSNVPQPDELYEEDDDVDAALSELQVGPPMDICNNISKPLNFLESIKKINSGLNSLEFAGLPSRLHFCHPIVFRCYL